MHNAVYLIVAVLQVGNDGVGHILLLLPQELGTDRVQRV